jgi:UPF0755 protein
MLRRLARLVAGLFAVLVLLAGAGVYGVSRYDQPGPLAAPKIILVPRGASTEAIAGQMESEGAVQHRWMFLAAVRITELTGQPGASRPLKAGEYEIPAAASLRAVLDQLREGRTIVHRLTVPEGLTVTQILELLRADPVLTGDVAEPPAEGSLLPETYNFARGDSRTELLSRMKRAMDSALDEAWKQRAENLPVSDRRQALILASVVEKETGIAAERPKVATVFVNRLKKSMRLQSDPTVIYGVNKGAGPLGRPLSRADLDTDTPYNSYTRDGLPPGPICNPGRASLMATLRPEPGPWVYFVADGTGGHAFAETLEQHNRNVQAWRKLQAPQ